jgi:hypothetical protein
MMTKEAGWTVRSVELKHHGCVGSILFISPIEEDL